MKLSLSLLLLFPIVTQAVDITRQSYVKGMDQTKYFKANFYCHHIVAVDADGSALLPVVIPPKDDGSFKYSTKSIPLDDEESRGATVESARLAAAVAGKAPLLPVPFNKQMATHLRGREPLANYLGEIFDTIDKEHPAEVIIYVHGGLNNIDVAIAKSAYLADILEPTGKYFIGICWNSDLFPTYGEHLFSIRDGLRQRSKAVLTSPLMFLSDFGGAAARLPLSMVNFWYQDAYTVNPAAYKRTKLASLRYSQINDAPDSITPDHPCTPLGRLTVKEPDYPADQTTKTARKLLFCSWLATEPLKISTTILLDGLATQPWKNMLRRTRTMFERESEFLPELDYSDVDLLARYQAKVKNIATVDAKGFLENINTTGRVGAIEAFCYLAQKRLGIGGPAKQTVTLVGHSMGAIVACEMVSRFHQLPLDNLVFEAAACSIRDFKTEVIPFMEEQNLREQMWNTFKAEYHIKGVDAPVRKTHVFNLCLHDNAENGEVNPLNLDLCQRGSLLTWIDTLYQSPESENDRTLGRWVNAILMTDFLPKDTLSRMTVKEFGRNRITQDVAIPPRYGYTQKNGKVVLEPMKHGDFTRFEPGPKNADTNLEFWSDGYRQPEVESLKPPAPGCRTGIPKNVNQAPTPRNSHAPIGAD